MRHKYGIVLCLVVLSFIVQTAAPDTDLTRLVIIWLQAVTLVLAVQIAGGSLADPGGRDRGDQPLGSLHRSYGSSRGRSGTPRRRLRRGCSSAWRRG